jgi:hypothetical protein
MSVLEILGNGGDTKIEWDPDDPESVAQAKAEFEAISTGRGMRIMKLGEEESTVPVTEFDPSEGRYVAIPNLVGG